VYRDTIHQEFTGARPPEASDHVEECGRGSARLAEQRQALAGWHLEADTSAAQLTSARGAGPAHDVIQLDRRARPAFSAGRGRLRYG
jgi:hypothetical protein